MPVYPHRNRPSASLMQFGSQHNYPMLSAIFMFQERTLYLILKTSARFLHHVFPPRCPIPHQSALPLPTYSPIAYRPLVIPSVEVSKHQRTTCKFIYSLLSTPHNVSSNESNNKQPMNVLRNFEVCPCKNCYSGNGVIIL
jgi:hypothetical protein